MSKQVGDYASVADYIAAAPKRTARALRDDIALLTSRHGAFEHEMLRAAEAALKAKKPRGRYAARRQANA